MFSYFTDLQGSQTDNRPGGSITAFSYFTDLQGSQTGLLLSDTTYLFSYFTDLQGSQTSSVVRIFFNGLVTLLIYKVLKPVI